MCKMRLATSEKNPFLKPYKTDTETSSRTKQGSPEHQKECGCNWTDGAATNGASVGCHVIICSSYINHGFFLFGELSLP